MLTLAAAKLGSTVLLPSPVYPLHMPFTSHVGRDQMRSSVERPFSPYATGEPVSAMKPCSSNGIAAYASRSSGVSSRTLS